MDTRPLALALALVAGLPLAAPAHEEDEGHVTRIGDLEVIHAWARATEGPDGQVFMEIHNEGSADDQLLEARFEGAEAVEIHGVTFEAGQTSSVELGPVKIPGAARFDLEPNGVFLKLIGLEAPLKQGQDFDMVISFREAGAAQIEVEIEAPDAMQHSHAGHEH